MKRIGLLLTITTIMYLTGCVKDDSTAVPVVSFTPTQISELIVGNWQLNSIGTIDGDPTSTNTTTDMANGCRGNTYSDHAKTDKVSWKNPSNKENVAFAANGDFASKKVLDPSNLSTTQVCNGTYKVTTSELQVASDCNKTAFILHNISNKSLVVREGNFYYSYEKVDKN